MTRLKRSIEQRPSGNNAAAMSASLVQPAWDSKQSYYVRVANSASRPSRSTRQREQDALREVRDRQPDCQIRRQAPRPDHLSGADVFTSWCGQSQHDLTSTRQPIWAHKPLGAVERIRQIPNVRTATPDSMPMILGRPMTSW
jgi:hypothetical protein